MPAISIAMIVKNEAEHLPECIRSVEALAHEICVVDTGSSDGTPELARSLGCKTGTFAWRNDFSAARNASLSMCSCPWIFVLDADERIAHDDVARIGALTARGAGYCYRFNTRNYTDNTTLSDFVRCSDYDPMAKGFAGWHPSWKVRLFPNIPDVRFTGPVHELVHESLVERGVVVVTVDTPVHHYPLVRNAERIAEKQQLYLELGLDKVRRFPEDPKAHAELGAQHVEMGNLGEAIQAYKRALQLNPESADYLTELGGLLHLAGFSEQALAALDLATRKHPDAARAWRNLGVVRSAMNDWKGAVRCFETALRIAPESVDLRECLDAARNQID